jgi:voltage-gated potassium channel
VAFLTRRSAANRRGPLTRSVGALVLVSVGATIGYLVLGLGLLDAIYQTVITLSTVGYREIGDRSDDNAYQVFTIVVVIFGVGTALYTLGVLFETLVEGRLEQIFGRRRMERDIAKVRGHIVLCGAGRVGRKLADEVAGRRDLVIVEQDPERVVAYDVPVVIGDARRDDVLRSAGIERAATLITALTNDADNLYVVLTGRALNSDLFIVARAHLEDAEEKLRRGGADRVVNPQHIGGQRMATFALQPHVAEFLDVIMHEGGEEWRIEELPLVEHSALVGMTLSAADVRRHTGCLVLALRGIDGLFRTNPAASEELKPGTVLIAMGSSEELTRLERLVNGTESLGG